MTILARLLAILAVAVAGAGLIASAPAAGLPPAAAAHPEPGDEDGDEIRDEDDNCPSVRNGDQLDTDGDGVGDACDGDDDGDGVGDAGDNCRLAPNPAQEDGNGNGVGDACEKDGDGDGVSDNADNCVTAANPDQANMDGDALGDLCDGDDDADGVADAADNCPRLSNEDQADADGDGRGAACDDDERANAVGPPGPPTDTGARPGTEGGLLGAPDPADRRPPGLRLRLLRPAFRHVEVAGGLPVGATCTEACRVVATVTVASGIFDGVQLGRGRAALGGEGATWVFVRLSSVAARPVRRQRRVRVTLRVTATDASSNRTVERRTLVFRR
ncbi:MAG TPA: thrombospondin type 3 repeat-containing protein [Solirubrobacteraceae bacterium]|nr:thrombospondin type 3 repeat-containing protein [Solirubrobacteraceae bacterium]